MNRTKTEFLKDLAAQMPTETLVGQSKELWPAEDLLLCGYKLAKGERPGNRFEVVPGKKYEVPFPILKMYKPEDHERKLRHLYLSGGMGKVLVYVKKFFPETGEQILQQYFQNRKQFA